MITIFQGNEFSFPVEILNSDGSRKDLTGFTAKAGIRFRGETIAVKNCVIEGIGLISFPLTATDTAQIGVYSVEIRLEKTDYLETWGEFSFKVVESIILQAP